ncbi:MAG TPA: DUF2950 domain-containing protein [Stellaceae bacterium]|nr:DUF2950 domain-containing protein [Stellaceae bacterium]
MTSAANRILALAAFGFLWLGGAALAASAPPFASADQAVDALIAAVRSDDAAAIERVLGRGSAKLVNSGDDVADKTDRAAFIAAYDAKHSLAPQGEAASLTVGAADIPFPIPLRKEAAGWRFDPRAGAERILERRIGRNELDAIETCRAIVDAERDYASDLRAGAGFAEYARHFMSRPGKTDGLYWPVAAGAPASPLGPLVAEARAQGYSGRHAPYHGYYYKLLLRQGPHAPGGARDYIVKGHMIGGFAVVAYPAKWNDSGVMTFIVNQDGTVMQRNLGPDTARVAAQMTRYDPDPAWTAAAR